VINQYLPSRESPDHIFSKDTAQLAEEFNLYFSKVGESTSHTVKQLAQKYNIQPYTVCCPQLTITSDLIFNQLQAI
jgi:hypothetical protein